jgi:iron complex outermembrane receptor protein
MTREWRTHWFGTERERNRRNTIFSDVAITKALGNNVLVGGVTLERDQYAALDARGFTYRYTTPALYAEHTWTPDPRFGVTSGARLDLHSEYGDFVSPRMSVVVHPSETFTARLSAARGVYAPTPLTDETEALGLMHFRSRPREAEHATGWSLDLDRVKGALELRGSAYRTVVAHPLTLRSLAEELQLVNADQSAYSQGVDVSARYRMQPLRYSLTYSFNDAKRPVIGVIFGEDFSFDTTMMRGAPLSPQHAVGFDVAHERENDRLVGVGINVVGRQALSDTLFTRSRTYVTMDARVQKHVRQAILFISAKNLLGAQQDQMIPVLLPSSSAAGTWTREAWGPLEGRVINVGLRMKY